MFHAGVSRSAFQTRKPPRAGRPAWKVAEEFRRWLRKLPCARCKYPPGDLNNPVVAAHVDYAGKGTRDAKGTSSKVNDRFSIPLCNSCHGIQHQIGWPIFDTSLPLCSALALAGVYWTEWPGRVAYERELAERAA